MKEMKKTEEFLMWDDVDLIAVYNGSAFFIIWGKVLEKFNKESLAVEEQLNLLISRNLNFCNNFYKIIKVFA